MTDQEGSVSFQKPPRPVPFGRSISSSEPNLQTAAAADADAEGGMPPRKAESTGDLSNDSSRAGLQKEVRKRRMSLTPQELDFLEELIVSGNEVDLTVAHETLCDSDLFFEDDDHQQPQQQEGSEVTSSGHGGGFQETLSDTELLSSADLQDILNTSDRLLSKTSERVRSGGGEVLGSAKRQERLSIRKMSLTHEKMWKAHEHGVSIIGTRPRSKSIACLRQEENIAVRRGSFLSAETRNLIENGGPTVKEGHDAVFRRTEEEDIFRKSDPGIASRNSRKMSWVAKPKRPILRRLASEGSRKSVSFAAYDSEDGDHPTRLPGIPRRISRKRETSTDTQISELGTDLDDDAASIPSLHHGRPVRSESVSSIPSLHHPTPIRSDSVTSIPSLHHPNPIRSDSVTSFPSLHHAHHVHEEGTSSPRSDVENIDVSISEISLSSIPSLHHGHPLRDESLASFRSTASPPEKESQNPAWADPILTKSEEENMKPQLPLHPSQKPQRPVLMRRASRNVYNGEGIEVEELPPEIEVQSVGKARTFKSLVSFGDTTIGNNSVLSSNSFDQSGNRESIFRERDLRRSLSDEGRSRFFLGSMSPLSNGYSATSINTLRPEEDDASWDMDNESPSGHYDSWHVLSEDPAFGASEGDSYLSFRVLGTSGDDDASTPHVLSPPLMDSLRNFFPYTLAEQSNFWMKYSLLRDGDSFHSLLQKIRGASHTIIAIETVEGEVFGSFTSEPWRKNWKYFGTGESFLWRMRQSRKTPCLDVFDQARMETELDVYPWAGENDCIQLCTHDMLAVGGGSLRDEKKADDAEAIEYGFGLAIEKDLLYGTSSSCATFSSPPLSIEHSDGSPFEIVNLEVWALTPCDTLEDAEKLELGQLFLRKSN